MRKAHTAHAWSQKGALRPGNIKSHSCCCVAFNAEKRASRYSALRRKSIEPLPASILDSDSHAKGNNYLQVHFLRLWDLLLVLNFAILNMAACTVLVGEARAELLEYAVALLLHVACYLTFSC